MTAGPLTLAGGAEFDERMDRADRLWLAGRRIGQPRVGVFPTASEDRPDRAAANGSQHFRRLATHAEPVMVTTAETGSDERLLNQISRLDFAYFAGGNPLLLAERLAGSKVWERLLERWRSGMGLGGSSAGAMVMCESVFVRESWAQGLGLVPGTVLLPHFNRRDAASVERARLAVTEKGLIGLGVDESTALVWDPDGGWRVAGPGKAWLLSIEGSTAFGDGDAFERAPAPAA